MAFLQLFKIPFAGKYNISLELGEYLGQLGSLAGWRGYIKRLKARKMTDSNPPSPGHSDNTMSLLEDLAVMSALLLMNVPLCGDDENGMVELGHDVLADCLRLRAWA